jgi:hypothetical protein
MLQKARNLRVVKDFWWNLAPLPVVAATLLALNPSTAGRDDDQTFVPGPF